MNSTARDVLFVGLIAAVVLFAKLGATPLWDRDEPRNAGCAAEMRDRGDWVTPVFNDELRAHKPVLLYWLMMSAYSVFGVSEFAARFGCAALSVVTCCVTYDMGRRLFDRSTGLWAGVILASSLLFDMAARAATPDAVLICCMTLGLWAFVRGCDSTTWRFKSWSAAALFYFALGLAVLAKGPVGFLLPMMIVGLFVLLMKPIPPECSGWSGRLWQLLTEFWPATWSLRPLTGVTVVLLVAAPWYLWVGLRTDGEFLRVFFWEHNVSRATQAMEGHRGPFGLYYVGAILIGFFPWSVFAGLTAWAAIRRVRSGESGAAGSLFAMCWVVLTVLLFSCAQTKLPSYVTPCYPALALLTGAAIREWTLGVSPISQRWWRASLLILGGVGLTWLVAWPFISARLFPGDAGLAILGFVLVAGAATALIVHERQNYRLAAKFVAITSLLFVCGVFSLAMPAVGQHQQNRQLLMLVQQADKNVQVGAFGQLEPSWVFYGGRPIQELTLTKSSNIEQRDRDIQLASHQVLTKPNNAPWQPRPRQDVRDFFRDGDNRVIITTDRHWLQLQPQLPSHAIVLAECPLFLKKDRLLLIGRK